MGFGYTKGERLLKRRDYTTLSTSGKKVGTHHLLAIYKKNNVGRPRLGVTVTKKVGGAVVRNRIKRQVREYFRLNRHQIKASWDINIIAKKNAATLSPKKLYSSISQIFSKISD